MGKKRVIKQSQEEIIKEGEKRQSAEKKAINRMTSKGKSNRTESGCIFIQSTYNNTIITVTDKKKNILAWASAGSVGFKGPRKATPYAASRIVETLMEKINKIGLREVSVYIKGVGSGRESAVRALAAQGLEISMIKDVTPIPHNGCRPPKVRRV